MKVSLCLIFVLVILGEIGCAVHNVNINKAASSIPLQSPIAVLEFEDGVTRRTNPMFNLTFPKNPGRDFSDVLTSSLVKTKKYVVIERMKLNKILKEQGFAVSGLADESNAIDLGKIAGVKYIVIGNISDMWFGSDGLTHQSAVEGSFRIINVENAETVVSGNFSKRRFSSDITTTIRSVTDDIAEKLK